VPEDLPDLLRRFAAEVPTLSLATADDAGRPHAANLNFAADDALDLFFLSKPTSAHAVHLNTRPEVAATAYAPFESPEQIRGMQIHGRCEAADPADFEATWQIFCAKFPYARDMESRARGESFYRLRPRWIRWIDNRVSFGFKIETPWPPPRTQTPTQPKA